MEAVRKEIDLKREEKASTQKNNGDAVPKPDSEEANYLEASPRMIMLEREVTLRDKIVSSTKTEKNEIRRGRRNRGQPKWLQDSTNNSATTVLQKPKTATKKRTTYECIECGKFFLQVGLLNKHLKKVHDVVKLPVAAHYCRDCGTTWSTFKEFSSHFKYHEF